MIYSKPVTSFDPLVDALRGATRPDRDTCAPEVLDPVADRATLRALARDAMVIDTVAAQLDELMRGRSPDRDLALGEVAEQVGELLGTRPPELFGSWVHYPWSRTLVHVLPADLHRELRLDRNRHKITSGEQGLLLELRIAVAGLSVGRSVASTLVREGIGGEIRLADFDELSLSNLNRVPGGVADVGVNKAVLAAREVAELDPYLQVVVHPGGVRPEGLGAFLDGVDVLLDECDDLEMKLLLREHARAAGVPVVMVTSDRGLIDIERFDREPAREPFHGALAGITAADLRGLTTRQKVPYVLRILDPERLGARTAASLVEVKHSLSTWPQLASDVVLGGAMAANAVRRIALGELVTSGRYEVDLDEVVRDGRALPSPPPQPFAVAPAAAATPPLPFPEAGSGERASDAELEFIATCATLAPSGGNTQPWRFTAGDGRLSARLDDERAAAMIDIDGAASVLALGAALEAALIGARALGFHAEPETPGEPVWRLHPRRGGPPASTGELTLLHGRRSHRGSEPSAPITSAALTAMAEAAAPLHVTPVEDPTALAALGEALAALDRIRFLTPELHRELMSEIRWSREDALATRDGIDLAALGLDAADLAALQVLRSPSAMAQLRKLDAGQALGAPVRAALRTAGAALVLATDQVGQLGMIDAGRGLMRMWLAATEHGVGVHPMGSPLLVELWRSAPHRLDRWAADRIAGAARRLEDVAGGPPGTTTLLVLRLTTAPSPVARSVRRPLGDVLTFR